MRVPNTRTQIHVSREAISFEVDATIRVSIFLQNIQYKRPNGTIEKECTGKV